MKAPAATADSPSKLDPLTPAERSARMALVHSKDTLPERTVRSMLHRNGFRFRKHRRDLPGTPDIVFGPRRKIIFVNGCFWHGHACPLGRTPKTRVEFWRTKVLKNQERDVATEKQLRLQGWDVLTVWECELRDAVALLDRMTRFLGVR